MNNQMSSALAQEQEFRRFKPLKDDLTELNNLVEKKGLTREDLKVILTSIELSETGKRIIEDGKGF